MLSNDTAYPIKDTTECPSSSGGGGGGGGQFFKCILQGRRKIFDTSSAGKLHLPTHRKNDTSLIDSIFI